MNKWFKKLFSGSGGSVISWLQGTPSKNTLDFLKEYNSIVYACIQPIANDGAMYEPVFIKNNKPVPHALGKLLQNPNPDMSEFDFFFTYHVFMSLTGEAFWYVGLGVNTGLPKYLDYLRPDLTKVVVDDKGEVSGYTYRLADGTEMPLETTEVVHIKEFNPLNRYRGLGTVQAGTLYIDTEQDTSRFQRNFMRNQATPSGVLSLGGTISKEVFEKIKKQWKEQQSGIDNAGKTLIIRNGDAKFEKMGLSISDIQLEALKSITKEDVRMMFRVPKQLLGESESSGAGGLGRANIEAIEYMFARRVIEPKLIKLDDIFTLMLRKYWNDKETRVEHVSQIPADKEFRLRELEVGVDRWITRNEARIESGELPIDGGDKLFTNFSQVELGQPIEQPQKSIVKLITKDEKRDRYFRKLEKNENQAFRLYKNGLKDLLEAQKNLVLGTLNSHKQVVNLKGTVFELIFTKEELSLVLVSSLINSLINSAQDGLEFLGKPSEEFILQQSTRDAVFNSTERLMLSFNEETAISLQKQLAAGLQAGESVEQIAARIESVYKDAKGYRAVRIAQTEAHKATNFGVAESYRQAGVKQMRWVTIPPSCEFCEAMEGQIIDIGSSFLPKGSTLTGKDGGEFLADYADVQYADLHPHCDCKLEPVF